MTLRTELSQLYEQRCAARLRVLDAKSRAQFHKAANEAYKLAMIQERITTIRVELKRLTSNPLSTATKGK